MIKTLVILAIACTIGCATVRTDAGKFETAYATCAKADATADALKADAATAVTAGSAGWVAALDALALRIGAEAMDCTLTSLEAALAPTPTSPVTPPLARVLAYHAAFKAGA